MTPNGIPIFFLTLIYILSDVLPPIRDCCFVPLLLLNIRIAQLAQKNLLLGPGLFLCWSFGLVLLKLVTVHLSRSKFIFVEATNFLTLPIRVQSCVWIETITLKSSIYIRWLTNFSVFCLLQLAVISLSSVLSWVIPLQKRSGDSE